LMRKCWCVPVTPIRRRQTGTASIPRCQAIESIGAIMGSVAEYEQFDAIDLALIARREVMALEVLDEAITRAEQLNPAITRMQTFAQVCLAAHGPRRVVSEQFPIAYGAPKRRDPVRPLRRQSLSCWIGRLVMRRPILPNVRPPASGASCCRTRSRNPCSR
jgi:hypothetical protein